MEAVGQALGVAAQGEDPVGSLAAHLGDRQLVVLADEAERCVTEMGGSWRRRFSRAVPDCGWW